MDYQFSSVQSLSCVRLSASLWTISSVQFSRSVMSGSLRPHGLSAQFSSVAQSCPALCDPMDYSWSQRIVRQAPLSMRFYRQEYWSGLPCPPPRDLPDPEIEPVSLTSPALADGSFTTSPPGSPVKSTVPIKSVRLF